MGNGPEMLAMWDNPQMFAFLIPIVAIVGGLTFVTVAHWLDTQRKEREAYYKAETLRRITEASGEGAKAAIELMHADDRIKRLKQREGMKIAGLSNIGVGAGLLIFLHALMPGNGIYLCGMIPGLIGVEFQIYVFFLAAPIE